MNEGIEVIEIFKHISIENTVYFIIKFVLIVLYFLLNIMRIITKRTNKTTNFDIIKSH